MLIAASPHGRQPLVDGPRVRVEPLEVGERGRDGADRAQPFDGELLHRHRAHEVGDAEARVTARETVGRQHVVRAAAVVADGLRRPRPEKHRAGRLHLVEPSARLLDLQDQVLGRVAVRDRERRFDVVDDDDARVRERAFDEQCRASGAPSA